MTDKRYCSRAEAARRLGVTPQTISNYLKEGVIPFTERRGPNGKRQIFIQTAVVDALAEARAGEKGIAAQVEDTRTAFGRLLASERETLRAYSDYMHGLQDGMRRLPHRMETLSTLLDVLFRLVPGEFSDEERELLRMSVEGLSLEIMSCALKTSIPATQRMLRRAHRKLVRYPKTLTDTVTALKARQRGVADSHLVPVLSEDRLFTLRTPLSEYERYLSNRTLNCLKGNGIKTLAALIIFTKKELKDIRNFGNQCLTETEHLLERTGFGFGSRWAAKLLDDKSWKELILYNPVLEDVLESGKETKQ